MCWTQFKVKVTTIIAASNSARKLYSCSTCLVFVRDAISFKNPIKCFNDVSSWFLQIRIQITSLIDDYFSRPVLTSCILTPLSKRIVKSFVYRPRWPCDRSRSVSDSSCMPISNGQSTSYWTQSTSCGCGQGRYSPIFRSVQSTLASGNRRNWFSPIEGPTVPYYCSKHWSAPEAPLFSRPEISMRTKAMYSSAALQKSMAIILRHCNAASHRL